MFILHQAVTYLKTVTVAYYICDYYKNIGLDMSKKEEKDKTQLKTDQKIQLKTEKMTEFQSWLALQQRLKFEAGSEDLVI